MPRAVIDDSFDTALPTMTVLVPCYREEIATVRKTLLSAALQEYPYLRIVLLLDDPPHPTARRARRRCSPSARGARRPSSPSGWPSRASASPASLESFERASLVDGDPTQDQMADLAGEYRWAAELAARARPTDEPTTTTSTRSSPTTSCGALADDFAAVSARSARRSRPASCCPRRGCCSCTGGSPGPSGPS